MRHLCEWLIFLVDPISRHIAIVNNNTPPIRLLRRYKSPIEDWEWRFGIVGSKELCCRISRIRGSVCQCKSDSGNWRVGVLLLRIDFTHQAYAASFYKWFTRRVAGGCNG